MTEREAMNRALSLALEGWGRVAPNPMVGAVLLRGGEVIGEGSHREFGRAHAEVAALAACADARGATCVLNLEPCSHGGKTPACTEALRAAGVSRVVYALPDVDAVARGGADALGEAGIEVESGLCAAEAAALNASFLWSTARPERPFVALKLTTSLDGFLADRWGASQWISSPEARDYVHWLRAGFDGIAVGRRTADADDPQLTARGAIAPRVPPTRVIFSRSGAVRLDLNLVRSAGEVPTVLIVDPSAAGRAEAQFAGTAVQLVEADGVPVALCTLRTLGVRSLLVEGGAGLAGELLEAELVDRVYWIQAPIFLGQGVTAFGSKTAVALDRAVRWMPVERKTLGDSNLLVVDRELCLPGL